MLDGSAGSALALLDACLVTGYRPTPARGVSILGTDVTITLDGGHGFNVSDVILLSGFSPAEANSEFRVASSSASSVTFSSTVNVTMESGAFIKMAPLGWDSAEISTNVKVYSQKSKNKFHSFYEVGDTKQWDSSPFMRAQIRAFDMFDNGILVGLWHTAYLAKSRSNVSGVTMAPGAAIPWVVVGDSEFVYVISDIRSSSVNIPGKATTVAAFGNAISLRDDLMTVRPLLAGVDLAVGASPSTSGSGHMVYQKSLFGDTSNIRIRHSPGEAYTVGMASSPVTLAQSNMMGVPEAREASSSYRLVSVHLAAGFTEAVALPGCFFLPRYIKEDLGFSTIEYGNLFQRVSFPSNTSAHLTAAECGTVVFDIGTDWPRL